MAPELQRFYGGSPREWGAMPWIEAVAWYESMNRIKAQEMLEGAMVVAVGTVSMERDVHRDTLLRWRRAAGYSEPAPMKARNLDELKAMMANAGFGVEVVQKKGNA